MALSCLVSSCAVRSMFCRASTAKTSAFCSHPCLMPPGQWIVPHLLRPGMNHPLVLGTSWYTLVRPPAKRVRCHACPERGALPAWETMRMVGCPSAGSHTALLQCRLWVRGHLGIAGLIACSHGKPTRAVLPVHACGEEWSPNIVDPCCPDG